MTPILELRNVRKAYGDFVAVDDVSMAVPAGSIFGLLGPNGAGKTSSIRMIMNITAPDSGEVAVFGHPRTSEDLRRIGYLPEERGLYRKMTVMDQLVFLGEIRGLRGPGLVVDIQQWLERVELTKWAKSKIEELSKGMQQKVQLIGTVLHKPDLLILDEPFSGLDPLNQELFRDLLIDYRSQGKSVVLSTHGMELAERLCDRRELLPAGGRRRPRASQDDARGGAGDDQGQRREADAAAGGPGVRGAAADGRIPQRPRVPLRGTGAGADLPKGGARCGLTTSSWWQSANTCNGPRPRPSGSPP
jgi:ABC-type uncharacterized transport system ATPase subunit